MSLSLRRLSHDGPAAKLMAAAMLLLATASCEPNAGTPAADDPTIRALRAQVPYTRVPRYEGLDTNARSRDLLLSMDHHYVRADLIAEVRVAPFEQQQPDGIEFEVLDVWFNRTPLRESRIRIGRAVLRDHADLFEAGQRYVVLLSGGPWIRSPFTHGRNSVFRIVDGDGLRCQSGNPLYSANFTGFACSTSAYTDEGPMTLSRMRTALLTARERAVSRLPELAALLDALRRPIETEPTPAAAIDRTLVENEVFR